MIGIGTRICVKSSDREVFLAATRSLVAAVRAESGCLSYATYEDMEAANAFYFVGRYRDQAAVDAHIASAHVKTFMGALDGCKSSEPEGAFYDLPDPE